MTDKLDKFFVLYMEVSLTWRSNLSCFVLLRMYINKINCPLYKGVRYWECPLRELGSDEASLKTLCIKQS